MSYLKEKNTYYYYDHDHYVIYERHASNDVNMLPFLGYSPYIETCYCYSSDYFMI